MSLLRLPQSVVSTVLPPPGERAKTLLASAHLFLVIAVYVAVKAARDSLFLGQFGAVRLPYVIIAVAFGVGGFVSLYTRLARRIPRNLLLAGTLTLFASNLVLFWWLAGFELPWLFPVVFIWGGMYGVIAPAQVWTLCNELFTTRQAKRAYGFVGSGGILGGIVGGWLASAVAKQVGTIELLLVLSALLIAAAVIAHITCRYRLPEKPRPDAIAAPRHLRDSLRIIAGSRHLRLIAALVFLSALTTSIADYEFKAVASMHLKGDDLTAFFGTFYGMLGLVSFFVQILLAERLPRWFGFGTTVMILPALLSMSTVLLALSVGLGSAILLKGSDAGFKHSIDRSARELSYLPIDRGIKVHVKAAIDMVLDRLGDGVAGVLLLLMTVALGFSLRQVAFASLLFVGAWFVVALRIGRSYVNELRESIAAGRLEAASWSEALASSETTGAVAAALASGDDTRVSAAIELAAENPQWDLREPLVALARNGSPEVRARAMAVLLDPSYSTLDPRIGSQLEPEDQSLMNECIDLVVAEEPDERQRLLLQIVERGGGQARGVWVALLLRRLGPEFAAFGRTILERLADPSAPAGTREAAAVAVGLVPAVFDLGDLLLPLLRDERPEVVAAAIRSAGALGRPDLLRALVALLGRPTTRRHARQALAARREENLAVLVEALSADGRDHAVRRQIPLVLERIGTPAAIDELVSLLRDPERDVVAVAATALVRIRTRNADWTLVERGEALRMALDEARRCRRLGELATALPAGGGTGSPAVAAGRAHDAAVRVRGPAAKAVGRDPFGPTATASAARMDLLREALHDAARDHREGIFRILSLAYPTRQMLLCRRTLLAGDGERRANAAELLDNLRPRKVWRQLVPILEADGGVPRLPPYGPAELPLPVALLEMADHASPWVRAASLEIAATEELAAVRDAARAGTGHCDTRVRAAAEWALTRLDPDGHALDAMSLLDRVMALRRVELFEGVRGEQLSLVAAMAREVRLPAGTVLCQQHDPPGDLYVILEGQVGFERDGRPLGQLGAGESIGAVGLFDDEPRPVTATATSDVSALVIDRWAFEDVWTENPELVRSIVSRLAARLRDLAR